MTPVGTLETQELFPFLTSPSPHPKPVSQQKTVGRGRILPPSSFCSVQTSADQTRPPTPEGRLLY